MKVVISASIENHEIIRLLELPDRFQIEHNAYGEEWIEPEDEGTFRFPKTPNGFLESLEAFKSLINPIILEDDIFLNLF